ncbi:MAG: hypothetical protein ACRC5H_09565 [Treponemataceae bacterium]
MKQVFSFSIVCLLLFAGCASGMKSITIDLTEQQLNQKAQEFLDKGKYKTAAQVYEIILQRYGSNIATQISAEFEIAHILVKEKKWQQAYDKLVIVLAYFENDMGDLPNEFKKLAQLDLERVKAKLKITD